VKSSLFAETIQAAMAKVVIRVMININLFIVSIM